jgi:hypothetical protein
MMRVALARTVSLIVGVEATVRAGYGGAERNDIRHDPSRQSVDRVGCCR